ncbi:MAG: type I polyketide synthase, partial [Acidobacteria bacterium]|nr:type I polyketide synthase [Acidobacteriota bacterium]
MTYSENIKKNTRTGLEVAVIGMTGRFPGARNIHEYWENLKNGVESISFFSNEELEKAGVAQELINNPAYVKAFGDIENAEYFDAYFFGYTPNEAEIMNPEMRFFHESAWEALEDAGYNPESFDGLIGVYAGASSSFFWEGIAFLSGKTKEIGDFASGRLICTDFLTTMISYKFNLKGPSVFIQTACSTSLVAIHWACRAVLSGECQMALAGGVSLDVQKQGYMYEEGMISSPDGHCRAFSAEAGGTVGGNGIGIVVLKRLKNAIADRDHIYAIIKGSAVNNDGNRKVGYAAPSVLGQAEAIRTAQAMAHVESESIGYIETHGTGTALGDPVEIEALTLAFNTGKRNYCPIGSVKPNIGHLGAAAGVAGLIKTVLALNHRLIPPSLHCQTPNPKIDFKNSPFFVNTRLMEWKNNGDPRLAGVSSFGIGGTNAHVVLEEWPLDNLKEEVGREFQLFLLSAKTQIALDKMTENLAAFLNKNRANSALNLSDTAYTLMVGRKHFDYRRMIACKDIDDAITSLSTPGSRKVRTFFSKEQEKPVIFMFPGLGSQYVNMGRKLFETEPVFRDQVNHCFEILKSLIDDDIKEILYPGKESESAALHKKIKNFEIAQPVIFIFEYALAQLLLKWGITPTAMIGYSFGEYVAACLAGVFSLEEALKLIVSRGKLISRLAGGVMLSVPLPKEELIPLLNDPLAIAIDNGPSCIIAGPGDAIETLQEQLKAKKCMCMPMDSSYAMHSKMMSPVLAAFTEIAGKIKINSPQIPYISNLTGTWITAADVLNPSYWSSHLSQTVQFADGIKELLKKKNAIFIEVGPGRDLKALVGRYFENSPGYAYHVVNLVKPAEQNISDIYYLLNKIGHLWLYGLKMNWEEFYSQQPRGRISLPAYPFEKQHYWIEGDLLKMFEKSGLVQKSSDIADWAYLPLWKRSFPGARNKHKIQSESHYLIFL